jgi:L-histidine N-alpha-methyltransferase
MASRPVPRLTFEIAPLPSDGETFAEHVRTGLGARPKRLEPRYLYDEIGSALYEAVALLPEYYLTAAESEILRRRADAVFAQIGDVDIFELGPGNGRKSRILLEAALRKYGRTLYRPIDISLAALQSLSHSLVAEYENLRVEACCGDYLHVLQSASLHRADPVLVLFLGSSIGNYEPREALALMQSIARGLHPGDAVLLGVDLKKSRHKLELAYDDPGGVTAAFNRNLLARINRELGGTFDLHHFRFVVHYDEHRGCVDSFQESIIDQSARIDALDTVVEFVSGERILTESSYKYAKDDIVDLATACGFKVTGLWADDGQRFLVVLLIVR